MFVYVLQIAFSADLNTGANAGTVATGLMTRETDAAAYLVGGMFHELTK